MLWKTNVCASLSWKKNKLLCIYKRKKKLAKKKEFLMNISPILKIVEWNLKNWWSMTNCELLWYTYFFSISITTAFFLISLKGGVWKKSILQCKIFVVNNEQKKCEQKKIKFLLHCRNFKRKKIYYYAILPLRAIEETFWFSFFNLIFERKKRGAWC